MTRQQFNSILRKSAPVWIVVAAIAISVALISYQPSIPKQEPSIQLPVVSTLIVTTAPITLSVHAQGLVQPHKKIALASQIAGRVVWVSDNLHSGGKFEKDESLLKIERADYVLQQTQAKATHEKNKVELDIANKDYARQKELFDQRISSTSKLDDAFQNLKRAEAQRLESQARLEQANLNLSRTEILAPFPGRVQSEQIDEGGYIQTGQAIATLYADDIVEVRLPIANQDLGYLNWPSQMRGSIDPDQAPEVTISSHYGGVNFSWRGLLVRVESEVDSRNQLFYAVAEIINPESGDVPPLTVGLFVDAEIEGRIYENAISIPRRALVEDVVYIVDPENRLRKRVVETIRIENDVAIINSGLTTGERICITLPSLVVEGMQVSFTESPED